MATTLSWERERERERASTDLHAHTCTHGAPAGPLVTVYPGSVYPWPPPDDLLGYGLPLRNYLDSLSSLEGTDTFTVLDIPAEFGDSH